MKQISILSITHEQMTDLIERAYGNVVVQAVSPGVNALHVTIKALSDKIVFLSSALPAITLFGNEEDIKQIQATMLG